MATGSCYNTSSGAPCILSIGIVEFKLSGSFLVMSCPCKYCIEDLEYADQFPEWDKPKKPMEVSK